MKTRENRLKKLCLQHQGNIDYILRIIQKQNLKILFLWKGVLFLNDHPQNNRTTYLMRLQRFRSLRLYFLGATRHFLRLVLCRAIPTFP